MGSSFTNMQIYIGSNPKKAIRNRLIGIIKQTFLQAGYIETFDNKKAQRRILISPLEDEAWLTVFDGETNNYEAENLAKVISKKLLCPSVLTMVQESQNLEMSLFRNGSLIDRYFNRFYSAESETVDENFQGQSPLWRDLLTPNTQDQKLRNIWNENYIFPEDMLQNIAGIFGWNLELAATRVGDVDYKNIPGFTCLCFRAREKSLYEERVEGPPVLRQCNEVSRVELAVGEPLNLHYKVYNYGGSAQGLRIIIWGSAVSEELVGDLKLQLFFGKEERNQFTGIIEKEDLPQGSAKEPLLIINYPKLKLPSGFVYVLGRSQPGFYYQEQIKDRIDTWFDNQLNLFVRGTMVGSGETELNVALVPEVNPEAGKVLFQTKIMTIPKLRRPLKALNSNSIYPQLRALNQPHILFALVVLNKITRDVIRELFEEWHEVIAPDQKGLYEVSLTMPGEQVAKIKHLKAKRLAKSKQWQDYTWSFTSCVNFKMSLTNFSNPQEIFNSFYEMNHTSGFGLFNTSTYEQRLPLGDQTAPQVLFWLNAANNKEWDQKAERRLTLLVDRLMAETNGIQGMMARWAYPPGDPGSHNTIYEDICGIHTSHISQRWSRRFLRGIAETLWLGKDLNQKLGEQTYLKRIAEIALIGKGIRLSLKETGKLDDLEQILEPLLANAENWQEFISEGYWHKEFYESGD